MECRAWSLERPHGIGGHRAGEVAAELAVMGHDDDGPLRAISLTTAKALWSAANVKVIGGGLDQAATTLYLALLDLGVAESHEACLSNETKLGTMRLKGR